MVFVMKIINITYTERGEKRKLWGLLHLMMLKTIKEYSEEFHQVNISSVFL